MRLTRSGNWAMDWIDYNMMGPKTTFYHLKDVVKALVWYGYDPNTSISNEDATYMVTHTVNPFRTN